MEEIFIFFVVNYLFDGVDEREDEGGNSKIEDLKIKGGM